MHDRLGTVVAAFAEDWYPNYEDIQCFQYDAFGTPKFDPDHDPSLANRLQILHAGRRYDTDTQLYNNRARWYDAGAGRFLSEDPIGFAAGDANLYRYCGNSPTNLTDPSGKIVPLLLIGAMLYGTYKAHQAEAQYDEMSQMYGKAEWTQEDAAHFRELSDSAQWNSATANITAVAGSAYLIGMGFGVGMGVAASFGTVGTAFGLGFSAPFMVAGGMQVYDTLSNLGQMSGVQRYEALGSLGAGLLAGGAGGAKGFGIGRGATSAWLLSGSRANWLLSAGRGTMRSGILRSNLKYAYNTGAFFAAEAASSRGLTRLAPSATRPLSSFADEAAQIRANAAASRGLTPNATSAAMRTADVELSRLSPPSTRPFADPVKLERMGPFDWNKYEPIWVQEEGGRLTIMNGMTRVEAARRAGITKLPAYIFKD